MEVNVFQTDMLMAARNSVGDVQRGTNGKPCQTVFDRERGVLTVQPRSVSKSAKRELEIDSVTVREILNEEIARKLAQIYGKTNGTI